jgi:hypothetical protein
MNFFLLLDASVVVVVVVVVEIVGLGSSRALLAEFERKGAKGRLVVVVVLFFFFSPLLFLEACRC